MITNVFVVVEKTEMGIPYKFALRHIAKKKRKMVD